MAKGNPSYHRKHNHFQTQGPWNLWHIISSIFFYPLALMKRQLFAGACHTQTACGSRTALRRTRRSWGVGRERATNPWPVCWRNSLATTKVSHTRNCRWAVHFCCIACQISHRLLLFLYSVLFVYFYLCYVELCLIVLFVCVWNLRDLEGKFSFYALLWTILKKKNIDFFLFFFSIYQFWIILLNLKNVEKDLGSSWAAQSSQDKGRGLQVVKR